MNRGMKVLQTLALPLGYGAIYFAGLSNYMPLAESLSPTQLGEGYAYRLERKTGFEPATSTLARSHSTTESLPQTCEKRHFKARNGDPEGTRTLDL